MPVARVYINAQDATDHIGVGQLEGTTAEMDTCTELIKDFCKNNPYIKNFIAQMDGGPIGRPNNPPPF